MPLRDYQKEAIESLEHRRDLIYLSTGSGKSVIFKAISEKYLSEGKCVCFVVYGRSIVDQAARKHFSEISDNVCMVMGAKKFRKDADLYCCSISTLQNNKKLQQKIINRCSVIIVDEAHNATSKSYKSFLNEVPLAIPVIGLTATPFWIGKKGHDYWRHVIHPISTLGLVREGYLVMPKVFGPAKKMNTDKVKSSGGDYNSKDLFEANDDLKIYSDLIKSWEKYAKGLRTIVFCINREHAANLVSEFRAAGYRAAYADANTPLEERLSLAKKLEKKEIDLLMNVNIFSTGVDIPAIECALMARPTRSLVLWIQQVGRALRLCPEIGKKQAVIIDAAGNCDRLGHPLSDFKARLKDKPKGKKNDDNGAIKTKECPECGYVTSENASSCISCGASFKNEPKGIEHDKETQLEEKVFVAPGIEKDRTRKYLRQFVKKDLIPGSPEAKLIGQLCDKNDRRGHKLNAIWFKLVAELPEADKYIRIPGWVQRTQNINSSSKGSDSLYKRLSQKEGPLSGTLESSRLKLVK
jgi:DNA repair protein RadD